MLVCFQASPLPNIDDVTTPTTTTTTSTATNVIEDTDQANVAQPRPVLVDPKRRQSEDEPKRDIEEIDEEWPLRPPKDIEPVTKLRLRKLSYFFYLKARTFFDMGG